MILLLLFLKLYAGIIAFLEYHSIYVTHDSRGLHKIVIGAPYEVHNCSFYLKLSPVWYIMEAIKYCLLSYFSYIQFFKSFRQSKPKSTSNTQYKII